MRCSHDSKSKYFNSRPRVGGVEAQAEAISYAIFQFSPPRRGRHGGGSSQCYDGTFQFSPPRRGRRKSMREYLSKLVFQFSPPRRGLPLELEGIEARLLISILAPA